MKYQRISKQYFQYSDIPFQLVPPHMHRRNSSEKAMRKFKNHCISFLCTVDPLFIFYFWDRLLPQVTMTLHMLRQSQLSRELSAYEQVNGIHNFECTPLATLGYKVENYDKSHKQLTYAPHSVDGWYLGPAVHNYRCYTCYKIDNVGETTPAHISCFPVFLKIPNYSSIDMAIHDVADM